MRLRVPAITLACSLAATSIAAAQPETVIDRPWTEQGYTGLTLRDIPGGHTIASWIFPGPLQGEGLTAPTVDLARPDLIVSVDGRAMNAEKFRQYVRASSPGDRITIRYRRSNQRSGTIPETLDHEEDVRTLEVVLASRDEWSGTMGRERDDTRFGDHFRREPFLDPSDPDNVLGAAIKEHDLGDELTTLIEVFDEWNDKGEDFHSLSLVRAGFESPFRLDDIGRILTTQTAKLHSRPGLAQLFEEALDVRTVGGSRRVVIRASKPEHAIIKHLAWAMSGCEVYLGRSGLPSIAEDPDFAAQCVELLRVPRRTFYITGPETKEHLSVIRRSMDVDFAGLLSAVTYPNWDGPGKEALPDADAQVDVPAELAGAIDGPILAAALYNPVGWIILGSAEANRYDMARIVAVYDPGGDDEYYATDLRIGSRAIIDLAGNDVYTGTPEQGPGGALLGVSYIDDRAGDDRYEGELLSAGAAMFGVSLLLDRDGNDTYIGKEWSLGAACYGAGMIIDLGAGNDTYLGDFLCQGVGGPRGFGCIVDENGRDLYRANGPTPSAYGTPAVYQSFSQGIGFGFRHYAAGGIGLISDLGGDDRYEAGEFAQGGAYYYGLGILHDAAGRDLYYGNRYGQGFGVHQAIGMLIDDAGDDTYWSMTAASQGAAWDIGVGMLLDRAGNDTYQCDGLGQGGASMQGIAMLIDMDGADRYASRGGATQGQSGGNSYHYHETGALSFSLLLDLGADEDFYSTGRPNNTTQTTGELNAEPSANSNLHGLFIDR